MDEFFNDNSLSELTLEQLTDMDHKNLRKSWLLIHPQYLEENRVRKEPLTLTDWGVFFDHVIWLIVTDRLLHDENTHNLSYSSKFLDGDTLVSQVSKDILSNTLDTFVKGGLIETIDPISLSPSAIRYMTRLLLMDNTYIYEDEYYSSKLIHTLIEAYRDKNEFPDIVEVLS